MAPNPNVAKAFRTMKSLGIAEEIVKPVLKNLIQVYDKNWDFIEADNYQALVDAIFESQDATAAQPKKRIQDADAPDADAQVAVAQVAVAQVADAQVAERKKKRLNEDVQIPETRKKRRNADQQLVDGGPEVDGELDQPLKRLRLRYQENHASISSGENSNHLQLQTVDKSHILIKPKEEPDILPFHSVNGEKRNDGAPGSSRARRTNDKLPNITSSELELASTESGEVKITMSCVPLQNLDEIFKRAEDKCLRSNKFLGPNFSIRKILNEVCECVLEFGTSSSKEQHEEINATPADEELSKSTPVDVTKEPLASNGSVHTQNAAQESGILYLPPASNGMGHDLLTVDIFTEKNGAVGGNTEPNGVEKANSCSLVVVENQELMPLQAKTSTCVVNKHQELTPLQTNSSTYLMNDISKGLERVLISVANEVDGELPLAFRYMPSNMIFEKANVSFSLSRMGENCCSSCIGDCISNPCACANATGGVVYTVGGFVREDFLEECISMIRDSRKHPLSYCEDCPLERYKHEDAKENCKGHLMRKFIKECWWKCGCSRNCGNRVVQNGIKRNLQVFMSPKGKGWGLRTLEDLPKGTFVCEFVGEILTIKELYTRVSQTSSTEKYEFPVLLDADWSGSVEDEKALCLDATYFGNVARFINHRCFDANLVGIPVEVDTSEHHYYRIAFFTSKYVNALEELTRDYGVDFDDHGHEFKTFECLCESKFCRNLRRKTRSRSAAKKRA